MDRIDVLLKPLLPLSVVSVDISWEDGMQH